MGGVIDPMEIIKELKGKCSIDGVDKDFANIILKAHGVTIESSDLGLVLVNDSIGTATEVPMDKILRLWGMKRMPFFKRGESGCLRLF